MGNCSNKSIVEQSLELANSDVKEFSLEGKNLWAKVVYVYDGDTIHIVFKMNEQLVKFNCRLLGIDSPEIAPKNISDEKLRNLEIASAIKSRNYLISLVVNIPIEKESMNKNEVKQLCSNASKLVWIKAYKFDKYGRLLIEVYNSSDSSKSFNQDMIDKNYAIEYYGGTKKQFNI
jgi:endonuclease YncB( thermonuclease family)